MRLLLKEIQVLREQKVLLLLKEIHVLREHEATATGPAGAPEGARPTTRCYRSEGAPGAEGAPAAQGDTSHHKEQTRWYGSEGKTGAQGWVHHKVLQIRRCSRSTR